MALPTEPVGQAPHIGIDDFSFRRGRKFGTIIVDLRTHQMLDVLPDRSADTSAKCQATHPEIELVSRDRGGDYAAAARKASPHATQIVHRFHLYNNLGEALEGVLAHHLAAHRRNSRELFGNASGGRAIQTTTEAESQGSTPATGKARGAPCPIPASCYLDFVHFWSSKLRVSSCMAEIFTPSQPDHNPLALPILPCWPHNG
jgi:hypothetical protein